MPLPYSFLLGLFCLFAASDLTALLPHVVELSSVLPFLAIVVVPWATVRILAARSRFVRGRRNRARALLMQLVGPVCYYVLLTEGEFALWVDQVLPSSFAASTLVKLLPMLAMEVASSLARHQVARTTVLPESLGGPIPFHLTLVGFVMLLVLLFTGCMDLLSLHRGLHVFVVSTALGNVIWIVVFLGVLCALLPVAFRFVARPSAMVPEDSRETARLLGFPGHRVKMLRTGNRLVNAMLIGPVPGFRYLFLTDGLVHVLDPLSLRGVVAHEVGHARANHPMLLLMLFGLVPLLLFSPLEVLGLGELDPTVLIVLALGIVAIVLFAVRKVAHRFELEADLLSADALGGSAPCILALHKVSLLVGGKPDRSTLRHPSEERRILHLLSCEGDPWFRERFERRGRRLRLGIAAAVVVAIGVCAWAQTRLWPLDRLILQFYTGDFVAAQASLDAMPEKLPPGGDRLVGRIGEELEAARLLRPDGGDWNAMREELAASALRRGRAELTRNGPRTARPWFALGMAQPEPSPLDLTLYLYCEAASRKDAARAAELKAHLLGGFELGDRLAQSLRDSD